MKHEYSKYYYYQNEIIRDENYIKETIWCKKSLYYGSYSRGEETEYSDLDLIGEYNKI